MWIVRIALSKPYTFIVLALLLLLLGILTILRTPKDIFPAINIPVVSVVWSYTGMLPQDMANLITTPFERALTTTVNNIEHIESQSLQGVSVTKIFFHQSTDIAIALSQVTAIAQTLLKYFPPGSTAPLILSYDATTVPIMQLVLSSKQLTEQQLYDLSNNFIRTQLAVVQGAALPFPYGGKTRQIMVDLNQQAMQSYKISAKEVNQALLDQNLIVPAGTEKVGLYEYFVKLNASPTAVEELNYLPIKKIDDTLIYIKDVAHVRDGFAPQTNMVRVDGSRAVLMSILKSGNASTLDIITQIKSIMPRILASMPPSLDVKLFGDQSLFVKAAIKNVVNEGVIAALLTGLMILLFVGNWKSALIITISIPLSILASLIVLAMMGQTINIMTLGGLALAVGILVDDATVAVENINWHLDQGKKIEIAILDGAKQIAMPSLVSTLCICIVFVPIFFLSGVAHFLFVALAEAVIFAMLASYLLSRTLVATLAKYWLQKNPINKPSNSSIFYRIHYKFEHYFTKGRNSYKKQLAHVLQVKVPFIFGFLTFLILSFVILFPWLGSDFFPSVDAGQIKMHIRAPAGTRVEETASISAKVNKIIKEVIPEAELDSIVDNIGLPVSGMNLSFSNSSPVGPEDADILIALKENHSPTADYIRILRKRLPEELPGIMFYFLPADMVGQILNFGLPAPINIQISGLKANENNQYAQSLLEKIKLIPGVVDAHLLQSNNYPQFKVNVNRSLAKQVGLTQSMIASNLLISLSGSFQTSPNFWVDPSNGVSYSIITQTPQYNMTSLEDLKNIPMISLDNQLQILGGLATIKRSTAPMVVSHYNVQPVIDIFAAVQDRDLGGVAKDINQLLVSTASEVPKGSLVIARGQMKTLTTSFDGLFVGLLFAIILVYLLMVVNFQSWLDPFIIITALPASIVGIVWMLFITHTPLSVPALTGAIMCIGIATANSILVVSFARERLTQGCNAFEAVIEAGYIRIRPVIMTALAMIIGMLPMALGLGEGGEQNAPLGRAVIGGLIFSTLATLLFVPAVFCLIHDRNRENKA